MESRPRRNALLAAFALGIVVGLAASVPLRRTLRRAIQPDDSLSVPRPHVRLRHEALVLRPKLADARLVLLGDSITEFWKDQPLWDRLDDGRAVNLGLMGDTAGGLLWRVRNGALDGLSPRAVVVLIGTNDLEQARAGGRAALEREVTESVRSVLPELHVRSPNAEVVMMGVLPRGGDAEDVDGFNCSVVRVNQSLASLARSAGASFVDLGPRLLAGGTRVPGRLMPDGIHLSPEGYALWCDALAAALPELVKPVHSGPSTRATTP
jgi:lysophospholipase L1-like esterase